MRIPKLGTISQDARYALRALIRQPGFALVSIAVLASVTGLNTSLFTFFSALTFHAPSGIRQPSTVVSLYPVVSGRQPPAFTGGEYEYLAEHAKVLTVAAVVPGPSVDVGERGASGRARTLVVSGNFFDTLRIPIETGRGFGADDDREHAPVAVALIGATLWESRFGSDPAIVGRTLRIDGVPFAIAGVVTREFKGLEPAVGGRPEVFLTRASLRLLQGGASGPGFAHIVGRLAPGSTRGQAEAEAGLLLRQYHAQQGTEPRSAIVTNTAFLSQPGRRVILVVLGMIEIALLLVWLLACANVGNLHLARAAARAQEIAIRLSLGASRMRVVRQLLTEGFVLALAAATVGVAVSYVLPPLLVRLVGDRGALEAFNFSLAPDGLVLGFALLLAAASSIVFGLAPALHATRSDVGAVLKGVGGQPASRFPLRALLLSVQVAVSVIVLIGSGLLVRRVQQQATFDPGVPVDEIRLVTIGSPEGPIDGPRRFAIVTQLTQSLADLNVGDVGFTTLAPFSPGGPPVEVRLPGESQGQSRGVLFAGVSPGYFRAMGIRTIAGRVFDASDVHRPVAIVNESTARRYWPDGGAVGKTLIVGRSEIVEIVGVVAGVVSGFGPSEAMLFRPFNGSTPSGLRSFGPRGESVEDSGGPIPLLVVRGGRAGSAETIAAAVAQIDPRLQVKSAPLSESLEDLRRSFRAGPLLAGVLGVFALALATVGMFGVFAYAVRRRTREIGIRMALGARPADVVRLIVAGHSRAVLIGLAIGLMGAIGAGQAMRGFLHGVSPFDPLTYLGVATLLACAGLAASYVPARRATRIDPIAALRHD